MIISIKAVNLIVEERCTQTIVLLFLVRENQTHILSVVRSCRLSGRLFGSGGRWGWGFPHLRHQILAIKRFNVAKTDSCLI